MSFSETSFPKKNWFIEFQIEWCEKSLQKRASLRRAGHVFGAAGTFGGRLVAEVDELRGADRNRDGSQRTRTKGPPSPPKKNLTICAIQIVSTHQIYKFNHNKN